MPGVEMIAEDEMEEPSLAIQLRLRRSEMVLSELETAALRLFEQRGFDGVTVEEIASAAGVSTRTFYRYIPTKEDVLQLRIDRRSEALRVALSERPVEESPIHSLRVALEAVLAGEDVVAVRQWIGAITSASGVLRAIIGGIQLKSHRVMAEFLAVRMGMPSDSLVPTMLAAATGGVVQAAHIHWYVHGGDLATTLSEALDVLEKGFGGDVSSWEDNQT